LSSAEEMRKTRLIAVLLIAIILLSFGMNWYFYAETSNFRSAYLEMRMQSKTMENTLNQVKRIVPKVTLSIEFVPTTPVKIVQPHSVTFLLGYVRITNLTDLLYPAYLTCRFNVTYESTNRNATLEYSFIPEQSISLAKGMSYVEIPWGLFPLTIHDFNYGDEIKILVTVEVTTVWKPVGVVMSKQIVRGVYTIIVGGEQSG